VPPGSRAIEIAPQPCAGAHLALIFKANIRPADPRDDVRLRAPREPTIGSNIFLIPIADRVQLLENGRLKDHISGRLERTTQIVEELS